VSPILSFTSGNHGAIPVLCSKLIEISYIDLAEQTLSTMEKISEEFPSAIVREGGLAALLNHLAGYSIQCWVYNQCISYSRSVGKYYLGDAASRFSLKSKSKSIPSYSPRTNFATSSKL